MVRPGTGHRVGGLADLGGGILVGEGIFPAALAFAVVRATQGIQVECNLTIITATIMRSMSMSRPMRANMMRTAMITGMVMTMRTDMFTRYRKTESTPAWR